MVTVGCEDELTASDTFIAGKWRAFYPVSLPGNVLTDGDFGDF